ncbi:MAG: hypothetical protein ACJAXK_002842, partial [Yoonia sp.]
MLTTRRVFSTGAMMALLSACGGRPRGGSVVAARAPDPVMQAVANP